LIYALRHHRAESATRMKSSRCGEKVIRRNDVSGRCRNEPPAGRRERSAEGEGKTDEFSRGIVVSVRGFQYVSTRWRWGGGRVVRRDFREACRQPAPVPQANRLVYLRPILPHARRKKARAGVIGGVLGPLLPRG